MKTKHLFAYISLIVISFSACKKYEEGPAFSLRGKSQRVINTWGPKEVIYVHNGMRIDSTSFYRDARYIFDVNDGYQRTDNIKVGQDSFLIIEEGSWSFENNKEEVHTTGLITTYSLPDNIKAEERANASVWEIKKLKEVDMWLWLKESDTSHYEFKFEPK